MSTWLDVFKLKGYYQSDPIWISMDGDGAIHQISWTATTPDPALSSAYVFTSHSFNEGHDWSEWRQAVNGGSIPDLSNSVPLHGVLLRYRVFLQTTDPAHAPLFNEITVHLEPVLIIDNKGDTTCTPEIWITKNGAGDFSLTNISNHNEQFKFSGLLNNETVYVNSEREYIETDLAGVYRYASFNDHYLRIPRGKNVFKVQGNAKIQFRHQFKLI